MITRDNVKIIKHRGVKIDTSFEIIRGEICLFTLTLMRHSKFHAYCAIYVNYMNHGLLFCALTFYNLNEKIKKNYTDCNDISRYTIIGLRTDWTYHMIYYFTSAELFALLCSGSIDLAAIVRCISVYSRTNAIVAYYGNDKLMQFQTM